ncbi:hypothetical protein Clacol_000393 [Clathrus columnatus]|uniref:Endonuclease/exonuclease/phosphatase domain-containing protein n=1 Tax=Clathrus columnatus TaxID=1419009 RepID=A0AAV5A0I3_9AGAM|nr:hypothetical protein Clacol_000393 [Clathrus columnatus]
MISASFVALVATLGLALLPQPALSQTINGMTYNIRFDSLPDNVTIAQSIAALNGNDIQTPSAFYPNTNERPWSQRRIPLVNGIKNAGVNMFGMEEALVRQVNDVQTLLGSDWAHVGVSRADGTDDNASGAFDNEFGPIFWKKSEFDLLEFDTFWLSQTPFDVGTKAPQAGTTARFKGSSGIFTAMVTHWDDQSDEAREVGASLIIHRANFEALNTKRPVLLFGDFNSPAVNLTTPGCNSCTNGAYQIITGASPPLAINETFAKKFPVPAKSPKFHMVDLKTVAPKESIMGNFATFTGFVPYGETDQMKRIDFIMAGSNGGWEVETYKVGTNVYDDGLYTSDHRPVFSDITLKPGNFAP